MRLNSIDAKRLESVEAEIKAQGGDCLSVAGDVGADDFPKKIVDATVQYVSSHSSTNESTSFFFFLLYRKWGKINHIVNNAGFTFDKMFHTMPDDTFDIIMKIHVRAPFRLIRQAAPYFRLKVYYNHSFIISMPMLILLNEPSLNNVKTAQLSMYLLLQVCMETLAKPTMPLARLL